MIVSCISLLQGEQMEKDENKKYFLKYLYLSVSCLVYWNILKQPKVGNILNTCDKKSSMNTYIFITENFG